MAEPFGVDLGRLANIVERMAHYQIVVDSMLDEVDTVVDHLHATWDGTASRVHTATHEQWKAGAAMMREALGQLRAAGTHAHSAYRGAIEANKSIWD